MMMLMSYFVLKLNVLQSIVVNITNGIALVIGDISAVFIMVKIYGYTHEMIKSNIMLSLIADLIIFGMYIIQFFN